MNKVVKLLKVKYHNWSSTTGGKFEVSYHMMNETEKQYKSIEGRYGWIVKKEDIGIVSQYDEIYLVADESNESQVDETVKLLVDSRVKTFNKKIAYLNEQRDMLVDAYEKFKKGE